MSEGGLEAGVRKRKYVGVRNGARRVRTGFQVVQWSALCILWVGLVYLQPLASAKTVSQNIAVRTYGHT
jgi:hypothetical protein